ncbi:MAG TPA: transcription antitermination factor NusB [Anaeromyxobacteraceae bacterium]|nr:transcription antitermination factor NusB [Anaeromyxobacteraceae bacterium]
MNARTIAFEVLRRVEEGGAYASRALDAALSQAGALDPREAALATELVYGTLRRALQLDAALAPHSRRAVDRVDPAARVALRLGAYQLLFLRTPSHAAVGETVALVKQVDHGRAAGYVNAVLRSLSRAPSPPAPPPAALDPVAHLAISESLPGWLAAEWIAWLGEARAASLAAAMNQPAPLVLRSPRRGELLERLSAAGVEARPTELSPHGVRVSGAAVEQVARAAGGVPFQVQDESAQLVTLFAAGDLAAAAGPAAGHAARDPSAPLRVLDLCAAPGGKAFHLAEILPAGSEVVAVEIHPRKADALRRDAAARGLAGVRVVCADGAKPIAGLDPGTFDAVLVDAPCAGLGTLRRHPELKLRRAAADLPRFAALQEAILANALALARPGAPVTYSVCSLSRAEGPGVVARLAGAGSGGAAPGAAPNAASGAARRLPPPAGFPAALLTPDGDLLALPDLHGGDGFYAARLASPGPTH